MKKLLCLSLLGFALCASAAPVKQQWATTNTGPVVTNIVQAIVNNSGLGSVSSVGLSGSQGLVVGNSPITGAGVMTVGAQGTIHTNGMTNISATFNTNVIMSSDSGVGAGLQSILNLNRGILNIISAGYWADGAALAGAYMRAHNNLPLYLGTSDFQQLVTITNTGNVGINVTNPVYTLDVNGTVRVVTNLISRQLAMTTNSGTMAPNFALGAADIQTNAAFTVLAPINVNPTNFETTVFIVTNSTAAAVVITAPANHHTQGTWYVTNVTEITVSHYGRYWSNAVALPLW